VNLFFHLYTSFIYTFQDTFIYFDKKLHLCETVMFFVIKSTDFMGIKLQIIYLYVQLIIATDLPLTAHYILDLYCVMTLTDWYEDFHCSIYSYFCILSCPRL
jgi:hypothetical protein